MDDAGARRDDDDLALHARAGAVAHLGEAGGVAVVDDDDLAVDGLAEDFLDIHVAPLGGDVDGGEGAAAGDDGGEADTDGGDFVVRTTGDGLGDDEAGR